MSIPVPKRGCERWWPEGPDISDPVCYHRPSSPFRRWYRAASEPVADIEIVVQPVSFDTIVALAALYRAAERLLPDGRRGYRRSLLHNDRRTTYSGQCSV